MNDKHAQDHDPAEMGESSGELVDTERRGEDEVEKLRKGVRSFVAHFKALLNDGVNSPDALAAYLVLGPEFYATRRSTDALSSTKSECLTALFAVSDGWPAFRAALDIVDSAYNGGKTAPEAVEEGICYLRQNVPDWDAEKEITTRELFRPFVEALEVAPDPPALRQESAVALLDLDALVSEAKSFFLHSEGRMAEENIRAFGLFHRAAEHGHAVAQCYVGIAYNFGMGVTQDHFEAVQWYRKAAEQGDADAQNHLGICCACGWGVTQNYLEAAKWYRKAAEQGNAHAQQNLAKSYERGEGVPQDFAEGFLWFFKAAKQGHADAQYSLGDCYLNGRGVREDYTEAAKWFRRAAEEGHAEAAKSAEQLESKTKTETPKMEPTQPAPKQPIPKAIPAVKPAGKPIHAKGFAKGAAEPFADSPLAITESSSPHTRAAKSEKMSMKKLIQSIAFVALLASWLFPYFVSYSSTGHRLHDVGFRFLFSSGSSSQRVDFARLFLTDLCIVGVAMAGIWYAEERKIKLPVADDIEETQRQWLDRQNAVRTGQDSYKSGELQKALAHFDTAIRLGCEDADAYASRASCLQSLGFDLDAIDDLTKAIELDPNDSNHYFTRSLSKGAVGDLHGRVADLQEAIRVAGIACASSRILNALARERGYNEGVAGVYRMQMMHANLDLEQQASDELRLQGPLADLGPDLASRRRAKARRRTQPEGGS